MRYAHYFKIPNEFIENPEYTKRYIASWFNYLARRYKDKSIKNLNVRLNKDNGDFEKGVHTAYILLDAYKKPRFIRYANHVKNARQLRK